MNVLILTTHLNRGGISSYIISLARGLIKKGNNVYIGSSGGEAQELLRSYGAICIEIPVGTKCEVNPKLLAAFFKLRKIIKERNIEIIHAHTRVTQVLGALLSKFTPARYLSTCHGFFRRRFSRLIFPAWGQMTIAISQAVAEHLEADFKVNREAIAVIHNGIDYEKFLSTDNQDKENIKRSLNLPMAGRLAGMVARLSGVKGHTFFISAMPRVLKDCPDVNFLIVGDGRLKKELEREVKKLGVERSVFFMPTQTDLIKIFSILDCLVSPSVQEGLGLSILEAQAAGVPVVAFATGGIVSLIENERTGLLVKPLDVSALGETLIRLLRDGKLREKIIRDARSNVKENFNIERSVEATNNLYSKILEEKLR